MMLGFYCVNKVRKFFGKKKSTEPTRGHNVMDEIAPNFKRRKFIFKKQMIFLVNEQWQMEQWSRFCFQNNKKQCDLGFDEF